MTEEREATLSDIGEILYSTDKDWFLSFFVKMANSSNGEIGITLNVGGSVISGTLISGKTYFFEFAKLFTNGSDNPEPGSLQETLNRFGTVYDVSDEDEAITETNRPVSYIHLKDAQVIFHNGRLPTNVGTLWRGKLTSVDGFSLGLLRAE